MAMLLEDLKDASRSLRKQPRFLIVAAVTLALGIGSVTAIFSVVNGVLLTPLPYPHADRLVNIWSTAPGLGYDQFGLSADLFYFYRRNNQVFEDMALAQNARASLTENGAPEVVDALRTTYSYFAVLGAGFARGRAYNAEEDKANAPKVAVVSHRLWTRRYGGDPSLVQRTVRIDGEPWQVVGIAPAWLDRTGSPDVWLPMQFDQAKLPMGNFGYMSLGRLKEGVAPDQAGTHLEPLVRRAMEEYIESANYRAFLTDGKFRPIVHSMKQDVIGNVRQPLWILLGTVAMVLLVACGNVANLCLVRAESRQRELAVRIALGGRRSSLVRKLLVEAFVLSAVGTALGIAFATLFVPMLLQLAPDTIPRLEEVRIDARVLLVAAASAILATFAFGLAPAIRYTRPDVLGCLRHGGRSATDHPSRQRGRQVLVVAQTAMALILLVGSGLLARSFSRLMSADQGFSSPNVLTFRVALPSTTYPKSPQVVAFVQQLVSRLSELPGVEAAGATTELPIDAGTSGTAFEIEGRPQQAGSLPPIVHYSTVTPGYFATLRVQRLQGADFDSGDLREGVRTIIVNKAAAERYWPGQDALGKRIRGTGTDANRPWYVVKGVVADVRHDGLRQPARPLFYFPVNPTDDRAPRAFSYVVRGPQATRQADAVRRAVWALNGDLPVASVRTLDEIVERSVTDFTFTMLTLGIAAVVALALGAIGLYGVLSYAVSLRTREIGVRIALGAPPSRVKRAVIWNAAVLSAIGLVVGVAGAAALTRFLGGLLYEVKPLDLPTFAAMSALLLLVALVAAYVPARKAASVSPLEAMKSE